MDGTALLDALLTPEGSADPYPLYARARELGPVAPARDGILLVSSYRTARQLLRDPGFGVMDRTFREAADPEFLTHASHRMTSASLLELNPPDHGRIRSLLTAVFTARRVATLGQTVTAIVERLLDELAELAADGDPVDFMDAFAFRLPVAVICELLGVPQQDGFQFRQLASAASASMESAVRPDELRRADTAADELGDYFAELTARRRARPQDDLVSALVQVADADPGRLSAFELLSTLVLLLLAGFETTTGLLGTGIELALRHPGIAAGLRSGRITSAGFTDEVLRYDTPVQVAERVPLRDGMRVEGWPAARGSSVLLLLGGANRDPDRFERADVFDPTRRDNLPLSFGGGAHFCLGAQLARMEAQIAFPAVLARFPGLRADGVPVRRNRMVLRGYQTLLVTLG